MADPHRLQQLQAQRDLIARHLAWLDQEIRTAQADAPPAAPVGVTPIPDSPPTPPPVAPRPAATTPAPARSTAQVELMAEEILQAEENESRPISKLGCWAIFGAIMVVGGGLGVFAIYLFWG